MLIGTVIGTPTVAFIVNPLRRKTISSKTAGVFADAGGLETFPAGKWTLASIEINRQDGWAKSSESRSVWVKRSEAPDQKTIVLSPICPHLGCPIGFLTNTSHFKCPCHGGEFDDQGRRVSGPPPRDMDSLDFEVRDGHLWVRWQDFKTGEPQRVAVNV